MPTILHSNRWRNDGSHVPISPVAGEMGTFRALAPCSRLKMGKLAPSNQISPGLLGFEFSRDFGDVPSLGASNRQFVFRGETFTLGAGDR